MTKTSLLSRTKAELLKAAQRVGLRGVTGLKKAELAAQIVASQQKRKAPTGERTSAIKTLAQSVSETLKRRAIRKRDAKPVAKKRSPQRAAAPVETAAHKFEVRPQPGAPRQKFRDEALGELPESYGTGRLFLTARDSQWLYAYWDLSRQQLAAARRQSADDRVLLRVFEKGQRAPVQEAGIQDDNKNWHVPAGKPATTYTAQLGYRTKSGKFEVLAESREAMTPAAAASRQTEARFATIPMELPFTELVGLVREHAQQGEQLAVAMQRAQETGALFPFKVNLEVGPWSPAQEAALQQTLEPALFRRMQSGSFEFSEWLAQRLREQVSSGMFSAFSPGASWGAAPGAGKGFWFAVNAELIIYGATEPDAKVTIDGRPIQLQPDGTFSFHFSFPDGEYRLPAVAVSKDGTDQRSADLKFVRQTNTAGQVGRVRQSPHLKSPDTV